MTLRQDISEILVKWQMPTRQAAISEIEQAVLKLVERARPYPQHDATCDFEQNDWGLCDCRLGKVLDQYHTNLLTEINGSPDKDS